MTRRNLQSAGRCLDCRSKYRESIPISKFYGFWTERFTMEEIREMANAIWG